MSTKPISQKEARRLRKRVEALESLVRMERLRYASSFPGGVHIATIHYPGEARTAVGTARMLGHAVVCTIEAGTIKLFALPHPQVPA